MSISEGVASVRLTAHAEDENTRIEVLDGNLNVVAGSSRLGETSVDVAPGAYAVRFRIGTDYVQRIAILAPGSGETHVWLGDQEAPRFATSAPVRHTRSTRETHREPARALSLAPPIVKATQQRPADSHLLLFARDLQESRANDPALGLSLHGMDGAPMCDFASEGERDPSMRWAGAHLEAPAGAYRLRLTLDNRRFSEQIVYLVKGWQTQVFLLAGGAGEAERSRRVQLASASVQMARPGQGFDPERPDLRWTESALRALRESGNIPGPVRSEMMWAKFDNPMLGIYAGLLHLRRREVDAGLLRALFHNLMGLVGPLPDVLAIGWGLALREPGVRGDALFMQGIERPGDLAFPPMLRASWDVLLQASVDKPALVPGVSFCARAAQRLSASGPWFCWRGEPPPAVPAEAPTLRTEAGQPSVFAKLVPAGLLQALAAGGLGVALPMLTDVLAKYPMAGRLLHSPRFTDVERRVAQFAYPLVDPQLQALVEGNERMLADVQEGMKDRPAGAQELVRSLGIPASTALAAVWGLLRKLVAQPVVPTRPMLEVFVREESHGNAALSAALNALAALPSPLRHRRGGEAASVLAVVFLRYRGSPAANRPSSERPTLDGTLQLLADNEYVIDDGAAPDAALFDSALADARERIVKELALQPAGVLPAGWQDAVLPDPHSYATGRLLPTPIAD